MVQENGYDVSVVQEKIREIIAQELELEPSDLTETGNFVEDYDADSLSLIAILARFDKELGVELPQDELENMADLRGVFAVIDKYAGKPQGV